MSIFGIQTINMSRYLLLPVLFVTSITALAQTFNELSLPKLPSSFRGSIEWADLNKDGRFDFLMTGDSSQSDGFYTSIYYSQGKGRFSPLVSTGLPAIRGGDATWGDYDNDGDLDVAIAGTTFDYATITKIYENDGAYHFTENTNAVLELCYNSNLEWGDYNKDGLLDLLVTGDYGMKGVAEVYANRGNGVFESRYAGLVGITQASVNWVDINRDGYLDIYTSGLIGGMMPTPATKIYLNNQSEDFEEYKGHGIASTFNGSSDWGDYDLDGDMDLLISGSQPAKTKLYKNEKSVFTEVPTPFNQVGEFSSAKFGDYDQDGDLDVVVTGREDPTTEIILTSALYENNGKGQFVPSTAPVYLPVGNSFCDWVDLDNDNDLDLYFFGMPGSAPGLRVFRNDGAVNKAPQIPTGLSAVRKAGQVHFKWHKSEDDKTPRQSLTYNIRVTNKAGQHVMNPNADPNTGTPYLCGIGNVGLDTFFVLNTQSTEELHWSVQAVDNSLAHSAFAPEQVVTNVITAISAQKEADSDHSLFISGSKERLEVHYNVSLEGNATLKIRNINGDELLTQDLQKKGIETTTTLHLSTFAPGLYLLSIEEDDNRRQLKVVLHE